MCWELFIPINFLTTSFAFDRLLLLMMFFINGIEGALIENSVIPIPNKRSVARGSEASSPHRETGILFLSPCSTVKRISLSNTDQQDHKGLLPFHSSGQGKP